MSDSGKTAKSIFLAAIEKPANARAAFLDTACGDDDELRGRVERLFKSHDEQGRFIENPAAEAVSEDGDVDQPGPTATFVERPLSEGPGTVIGNYKLLQEIGKGGMGVVYMAEQEEPVRRKVAVKIIKPGMDTQQVIARFEAERQALAIMDHQNIAKVLDAGTTKTGRPYFVMELVRGIPITKYCDDNRLTLAERLDLFLPVCRAIQHAHQKGIIHRDIKPSNVLVCNYDGQPAPKVIDFGVAKAIHQRLTEKTMFTQYGQIVGTLEYMSPEQAGMSQLDIDTRSDVYSLGVLLYKLLTGSTPLTKEQLHAAGYEEMLRLIREEEPQKPSTRLSGSGDALPSISAQRRTGPKKLGTLVRGDLDWIVLKALEKDRTRRYETANGLARDLQRHLADEPVEACPPSAGYRLRKLARKYKKPLTVAAAFLLLLVASVVVSMLQAIRATNAEFAANEERDRAIVAERLASERLEEVTRQKERVEQAEKQAAEEAAIAKAVNDFLQEDLLGQADTRKQADRGFAADPNLTVKETLHRAAAGIGDRFRDQPLVEAGIRQAIGEAYVGVGGGVGEFKLGVLQLEEALALRKAKLGPDHLLTLSSMKSLATAYLWAQQSGDALVLLEETVRLRKAKVGLVHPDTLESMRELAVSYRTVGRLRDALPLHEETVKLAKANLGPDHTLTLTCMFELAIDYASADRLAEAIALEEETVQLANANLGARHPRTLTSMMMLASYYGAASRFAEAIALQEKTLKLMKAAMGPDHPNTLSSMAALAWAYRDADRLAEAITLYDEVVNLRKAKLGPDHDSTLSSMSNLASLHMYVGKYDLAEPLLRDVLKSRRKLGSEDPHVATSLSQLGHNRLKQEEYAEAESLLRECLAIYEKKLPDDWRTFNAKSLLGGSLLAQQKYLEAEPLLVQGYEGIKQRQDKIWQFRTIRLTEALERLVEFYEATSKKDEAAKWRSNLEKLKTP